MTDHAKIAEQLRIFNGKIDKIMPLVDVMIKLDNLNKQYDKLRKQFNELEIQADRLVKKVSATGCIGAKELKPMSAKDYLR